MSEKELNEQIDYIQKRNGAEKNDIECLKKQKEALELRAVDLQRHYNAEATKNKKLREENERLREVILRMTLERYGVS